MKGIASLILIAFIVGCTPPKKEEAKAYHFYVDLDAEIEKIQNSDLQFVKIAERAGLVDTVIMSPNWEDEFGLFKKATSTPHALRLGMSLRPAIGEVKPRIVSAPMRN